MLGDQFGHKVCPAVHVPVGGHIDEGHQCQEHEAHHQHGVGDESFFQLSVHGYTSSR